MRRVAVVRGSGAVATLPLAGGPDKADYRYWAVPGPLTHTASGCRSCGCAGSMRSRVPRSDSSFRISPRCWPAGACQRPRSGSCLERRAWCRSHRIRCGVPSPTGASDVARRSRPRPSSRSRAACGSSSPAPTLSRSPRRCRSRSSGALPWGPITDALALASLGERSSSYGRLRAWASIGWAVSAIAAGIAWDRVGGSAINVAFALVAVAVAVGVLLPTGGTRTAGAPDDAAADRGRSGRLGRRGGAAPGHPPRVAGRARLADPPRLPRWCPHRVDRRPRELALSLAADPRPGRRRAPRRSRGRAAGARGDARLHGLDPLGAAARPALGLRRGRAHRVGPDLPHRVRRGAVDDGRPSVAGRDVLRAPPHRDGPHHRRAAAAPAARLRPVDRLADGDGRRADHRGHRRRDRSTTGSEAARCSSSHPCWRSSVAPSRSSRSRARVWGGRRRDGAPVRPSTAEGEPVPASSRIAEPAVKGRQTACPRSVPDLQSYVRACRRHGRMRPIEARLDP